jgi:hypothetical protein
MSRWDELIALANPLCHRSSPPKVRSADTRRNRSAIYRAVRRPANSRAARRAGYALGLGRPVRPRSEG